MSYTLPSMNIKKRKVHDFNKLLVVLGVSLTKFDSINGIVFHCFPAADNQEIVIKKITRK